MKKTIKAYLDRIEGDIAVVYLGEDQTHKIDIPLEFLPKDISEDTNLKISFDIDKKSNEKVGQEVEDLRKQLLENN